MSKPFKLVGIVGFTAILAQIMGEEPDGTEIPSFFAALMITKDGKKAIGLGEAVALQRITNNRGAFPDLVQFCYGYCAALREGTRTVMPDQWRFQGTILPKDIEVLAQDERDRLRAKHPLISL
jgi:hypothetical protein